MYSEEFSENQHQQRLRKVRGATAFLLGAIFVFWVAGAQAIGKRYSEQGGNLTTAMNRTLLANGYCKTPRDCYEILPGILETDSLILIHFFDVSNGKLPALLAVIDLSLTDGLRITEGVPITIKAFRESHEEYRTSGLIIKDVQPFMVLELNK